MMKKILILEDERAMAETLEHFLGVKYDVSLVHSGEETISAVGKGTYDAVIVDLNLPDMHGFDVIKHVKEVMPNCAIIVLTGQASLATAVESMQHGAHDFVAKPIQPERLVITIDNAIERTELVEIVEDYKKASRDHFQGFIGNSARMQNVYNVIENGAQSKAPVFITGESGTGKELAAHAVHNLSNRKKGPFEVLNCAAIPHNLLESEIFGHVKGAFTGATSSRMGAAMRANRGTLFLDEIGEMPIELQSKLLRFIQSGTFNPVGSSDTKTVDVRFICATNRDPVEAVTKGLLREDLYFRLNVIPVNLPPLRDRGEDIILLAEHFLEEAAREEGKKFKTISDGVKNLFLSYDWLGNVRELENTIRRVVVLNDGERVEFDALNILKYESQKDIVNKHHSNIGVKSATSYLPRTDLDIRPLAHYERDIIEAALRACSGNITQAAIRLGVNPATIHRKRKRWKDESYRYNN